MNTSRRGFMKLCGAVGLTVAFAPATNLFADPARSGRKPTLVLLFLRGGADGLTLVPPYAEDAYYKLRPSLSPLAPDSVEGEPQWRCLDLDGHFGLHQRLAQLKPFWDRGELAIVPAIGNPNNNRSHFTQQDTWETASADALLNMDGWLNRHLQTTEGKGPLRAVSVGGSLPRMLRGDAPAQAIERVDDLAYPTEFGDEDDLQAALRRAYESSDDEAVGNAGQRVLDGYDALRELTETEYEPSPDAAYPHLDDTYNPLSERLAEVARIIKGDVGLEIAHVDLDGWDTHQYQGWRGTGQIGELTGYLGDGLAAFARDLGDRMDDVLVMAVSEFGRTAAENGSDGTDHGHGGVAMLLGGPVHARKLGGRMLGEWPGLADENLNDERDLKHSVDFRDLYADVLTGYLRSEHVADVLPNHEATALKWFAG